MNETDDKISQTHAAPPSTRMESDSLGSVEVPSDRYWGAQTQRSLTYFNIGGDKMPPSLIRAFGVIKKAAALANEALDNLPKETCDLITEAASEVIEGKLDDHFPLKIWQTGSGTQTNMNANEVIANRAIEISKGTLGSKDPIHPNDHVNKSQSSNDTFPTAMHIAAVETILQNLLPAVTALDEALKAKQTEFADIVKVGRTHLQDAVPLTLGQEFSGYTAQLGMDLNYIQYAVEQLYPLALGATAVGTGLNAPPQFGRKVAKYIAEITQLPFRCAENKFAALSSHNPIVLTSAALKSLATSLMKIANDIRWLGSGPRCGLGELALPANEPGSSIMPGKVNPTQCEAITMVCVQVMGNDTNIGFAASQGNFELNVFKPMIIHNLLHSIRLLSDSCHSFANYCIKGLSANHEQIEQYLQRSLMLVTALNPIVGYDNAAKIAHKAHQENISLRAACIALEILSGDAFDEAVNPYAMTQTGD